MTAFGTATADTRYSFTGQFLEAAAIFVRKARAIEAGAVEPVNDSVRCEHRAFVSTAVMQCAAALETEAHEICAFGPGAHLGSNGTDQEAQKFLSGLAEVIDQQDVLSRYQLILYLLKKPPLPRGTEPYQGAVLLVRLRNELVHYKSRWGAQMTTSKLFASLEAKRHSAPPFTHPTMNFFPHRCLSADCGSWAVVTAVAFLDSVYASLGVPSRFEAYRARLAT
jgi:hypothetical protein